MSNYPAGASIHSAQEWRRVDRARAYRFTLSAPGKHETRFCFDTPAYISRIFWDIFVQDVDDLFGLLRDSSLHIDYGSGKMELGPLTRCDDAQTLLPPDPPPTFLERLARSGQFQEEIGQKVYFRSETLSLWRGCVALRSPISMSRGCVLTLILDAQGPFRQEATFHYLLNGVDLWPAHCYSGSV